MQISIKQKKMDVFTQYNLIRTNHYRRVWLD